MSFYDLKRVAEAADEADDDDYEDDYDYEDEDEDEDTCTYCGRASYERGPHSTDPTGGFDWKPGATAHTSCEYHALIEQAAQELEA